MLPSFIIDQIKKREEDKRDRRDAPMRKLPLPKPIRHQQKPDESKRGVVIIDLGPE